MFDFSLHMARLIRDMVAHTPELEHIDADRLVICASQQRKFRSSGLYAKVVPLRFEQGTLTTKQHGCHWAVPRFTHEGRDVLYIVSFCLPRFLNVPFGVKGETIFHELFHIGPLFDGDLRRFPGKYHQHGPDATAYDAHMRRLFDEYEQRATAPHLLRFLRSRFHHLEDRYGTVTGLHAPTPTPVRVEHARVELPPRPLRVIRRAIASARSRERQSA